MVQDDILDTHSVCMRCERKLTDPNSRRIGLGPVCRKKLLDALEVLKAHLQMQVSRKQVEMAQVQLKEAESNLLQARLM